MLLLKENDYLEVNIKSLVADYDRDILMNLYQPIVGYKAISLYLTLLTECENQKTTSLSSHQVIFNRTKMNASDFVDSRQLLEAVGLLKTYLTTLKDNKLYHYDLYAPKTPKLFFDNTLLFGLFLKNVGEVEGNRIKNLYFINKEAEGKDISATFMEVFKPDFDDPIYRQTIVNNDGIIDRNSAKGKSGFSYELFFSSLSSISQISETSFSKKDMKEIERLALLFAISEDNAAEAVALIYKPTAPKDKRIDFEALANRFMEVGRYRSLSFNDNKKSTISSDTALAHKINLMESASPNKYLSYLQNGTQPARSDLLILNHISKQFKLPNSVINAMTDYVLTVNNNILSKPFMEKIAGSLIRENISTALDAMNYFNKISNRKKKKVSKIEIEDNNENEIPDTPVEKNNNEEENWEEKWDELMKKMEKDDNGED